jgi:hypothetical protein
MKKSQELLAVWGYQKTLCTTYMHIFANLVLLNKLIFQHTFAMT